MMLNRFDDGRDVAKLISNSEQGLLIMVECHLRQEGGSEEAWSIYEAFKAKDSSKISDDGFFELSRLFCEAQKYEASVRILEDLLVAIPTPKRRPLVVTNLIVMSAHLADQGRILEKYLPKGN